MKNDNWRGSLMISRIWKVEREQQSRGERWKEKSGESLSRSSIEGTEEW